MKKLVKCAPAMIILLITIGCTSNDYVPRAPVNPVTTVAGTYVEPNQLENLRLPDVAKGYTIGRYIDPADPTVMHEQAVVYRIEEGAAWNLRNNQPVNVPFEGTSKPVILEDDRLLRAEMTAKANQQRENYNSVLEVQKKIMSKTDAIRKTVEHAKMLTKTNSKLSAEFRAQLAENKRLQEQIEALEKKIEVLLKFQSMSEDDEYRYKYINR